MKEKLDENLIKSLRTIARGIAGPTVDPDDLVSGALEYLISNEKKYMDHPNIKAILILKAQIIKNGINFGATTQLLNI